LTLTPHCFEGLPALATLVLSGCELINVPAALRALACSLTSLSLPYNDDLQLADDDVKTLLALRKLRKLDLAKTPRRRVPNGQSPWSLGSVQQLVDLPSAFSVQHGHGLALRIRQDKEF
jgi:Leucine-rich repeat (LRR) protein